MQRDTECLLYNMEDGVRQRGELILLTANTGELTAVGMEREDLGPMMSMYSEVSIDRLVTFKFVLPYT